MVLVSVPFSSTIASCKRKRIGLTLLTYRIIHVVGIYFFAKGFLLTRVVLEDRSSCDVSPLGGRHYGEYNNKGEGAASAKSHGCWHPKTFDKAIVIVIDALRYDFTVPSGVALENTTETPQLFHDNFPVLYETSVSQPQHAFLLPFIADPPTTTLQRLKGLTTGVLPTFVDAGANFAGMEIDEDNIISQLKKAGKRIVHLGDDTWHTLFPGDIFDPELSRPYGSFNVWDLHTLDNGVNEHLFPLVEPNDKATNGSKPSWDVIIGHYLGVDHAGHRYGANHQAMASKIKEMDTVVRRLIDSLQDDTLLVVLGDHGMDAKGDHGGDSDDEIQSALFMYSKQPIFGRTSSGKGLPPPRAAIPTRDVPQIDLVPTMSLLLGLPIPFNNLGAPIEEAFAGGGTAAGNVDWMNLLSVNRITSAQLQEYQNHYVTRSAEAEQNMLGPLRDYHDAERQSANIDGSSPSDLRNAYTLYRQFQRDTLAVYRALWAHFDVANMIEGIVILSVGIILLLSFARCSFQIQRMDLASNSLECSVVGSIAGGIGGFLSPDLSALSLSTRLDSVLLGASIGSLLLVASVFVHFSAGRKSIPFAGCSIWSWASVLFTLAQSIGYSSNSYTIWEDRIMLFFLVSFGTLSAVSSMRQEKSETRVLGLYHSILFVVLGRFASLSRLCRDEQMPFCRSTYYSSTTTSTSATWQLIIPFFVSIFLPSVIRSYYNSSLSYEGSAVFWVGLAFRFGLILSAIHWLIDGADNGNWLASRVSSKTLKTISVSVAGLVLAIAFAAGTTTFAWAKPCVKIQVVQSATDPQSTIQSTTQPAPLTPRSTIKIFGFGNIYGARYLLLLVNFALAIILLQKPMGGGAIGIQAWQILSLLEILDANNLTTTNSSVGPVVLGLLGSFHYFTTGHQATLSSIQWETAFIPFYEVRYPWSPILVIMNTFGAQILSAIAVPLCVLWKRQLDRQEASQKTLPLKSFLSSSSPSATSSNGASSSINRLLGDIGQAASTHILYYAVINLATTMWAGVLRRHLMLFRIFSPRFMLGATVLIVVDLVVALLAVGGTRWSTISVGGIFGW